MSPTKGIPVDAGRELDALIAEKVMGWRRETMHFGGEPREVLIPPPPNGSTRDYDAYPEYSKEIGAAWLVVEKLVSWARLPDGRACGLVVKVGREDGPEPHWVEVFDSSPSGYVDDSGVTHLPLPYFCVKGASAPHAICLAALKAVAASSGQPAVPGVSPSEGR